MKRIVDFCQSTLANDVEGYLPWQANKWRRPIHTTGEGKPNVSGFLILYIKRRNRQTTPVDVSGWENRRTINISTIENKDRMVNLLGGKSFLVRGNDHLC